MLSRTADNLYWLSRYVERAEYLARILDATHRLPALPLAYVGTPNELQSTVMTAGCATAFFKAYDEANEENVTDFLAFSTTNASSIRSCFELARSNARAVRTALTVEMWDAINGAWLELKRYGNGPTSRDEFSRFLRWVQESSLRFCGSRYPPPALGKGLPPPFCRLRLPHHASQRRLLVLSPRCLHRARRQHGAYPRR